MIDCWRSQKQLGTGNYYGSFWQRGLKDFVSHWYLPISQRNEALGFKKPSYKLPTHAWATPLRGLFNIANKCWLDPLTWVKRRYTIPLRLFRPVLILFLQLEPTDFREVSSLTKFCHPPPCHEAETARQLCIAVPKRRGGEPASSTLLMEPWDKSPSWTVLY